MKKGRKPGMNSPKSEMTKATRISAEHIAINTNIWNQRSRGASNFHRKIAKLTKAPLRSNLGKIANMTIMMIMIPRGEVISNRIHDDNNDDGAFGVWTFQVVNMTIMMTIKVKGRGHLMTITMTTIS